MNKRNVIITIIVLLFIVATFLLAVDSQAYVRIL